jgi:hypothetical protein
MKRPTLTSRPDSLLCPICETGKLPSSTHDDTMSCQWCGGHLSGEVLESLRQITTLPDTLGIHPCECGHPEMRVLPDGTYHCPSCGSEVLPIGAPPIRSIVYEHGTAYWAGWIDGQFGESGSFADNPNLARWEDPSDRIDYYRGHRTGSKAWQAGSIRNQGTREKLIG